MEEESDTSNWVFVEKLEVAEEAETLDAFPTPVSPGLTSKSAESTTVPLSPATPLLDSDQESDGSISILSDQPTDSCSEEETDTYQNTIKPSTPIIKIDEDMTSPSDDSNVIQVSTVDSSIGFNEAVNQEQKFSHQSSDDDFLPIPETSDTKDEFYLEDKTESENSPKKPFYLDCSQEPILEVSLSSSTVDTDLDTESTSSIVQESQTLVTHEERSNTSTDTGVSTNSGNIINGSWSESQQRKITGVIFGLVVLFTSIIMRIYLQDYDNLNESNKNYLNIIAENDKSKEIVNFCIERHRSKGEFADEAIGRCVTKQLKKKNKEEKLKKTEIYLQIKERILELREKELAEKEKELLKKWRKRSFNQQEIKGKGTFEAKYKKRHMNSKETSSENLNVESENCKRNHKDKEYKKNKFETKIPHKAIKFDNIKGKIQSFRNKDSWVFKTIKDEYHPKPSKDHFKKSKKEFFKDKEETFKAINEKLKIRTNKNMPHSNNQKTFTKDINDKKHDVNEEWYIKYNPKKKTFELINITTLPEQDFQLIKNGNKTINGQWYFNLYGSARTNIRSKERASEWYFRRVGLRENKRDKAKWYFDYMTARDNTRYFF